MHSKKEVELNYIGKTFSSSTGCSFIVEELVRKTEKMRYYVIKFNLTGYKMIASASAIKGGRVKDKLVPSVAGIGYLGSEIRWTRLERHARSVWHNMINRCYNVGHKEFCRYGAQGVTVAKEWHNLTTFITDIKTLHGYDEKLFNSGYIQLDKDTLCLGTKKMYSKDTCIFLDKKENQSMATRRSIIVESAAGERTIFKSIREACAVMNFNPSEVGLRLNKSKDRPYKEYKIYYA